MTDYLDIARAQLRVHEGVRPKPYRDSVGKLTIGVGRNLDDNGLRPDEIELMLDNDIRDAEGDARAIFPAFDSLSDNRRAALVDFCFNLGRARALGFVNMREAIAAGDFERAAESMLDSRWSKQVGVRALNLARQIREG